MTACARAHRWPCVIAAALFLSIVPSPGSAAPMAKTQVKCANDGHKYVYGKSASAHGKNATLVGTFERFHPCGEDDGYFTSDKKTVTLTLTTASKITVINFKSGTRKRVTAARFPHWFRKNKKYDYPIYRYAGPKSAVQKLSEHFVS